MNKLELGVRRCVSKRLFKKKENELDEAIQPHDYTMAYLVCHHVGFYFVVVSRTALTESFLSEFPVFFYVMLVFFCLSLNMFAMMKKTGPGWVEKEPENCEGLYFCKICQIHCPVRAGHCNVCGKCVIRRDHHCPWSGVCVGRDNHLYFYLWMVCELSVMLPVTASLVRYLVVPKPPREWLSDNGGTLLVLIFCGFDVLMTSWLVIGQTLMILNNMTVWEASRRQQITYLKDLPLTMRPFDKGLFGNIAEFVTMAATKKEWELPVADVSQFIAERAAALARIGRKRKSQIPSVTLTTS